MWGPGVGVLEVERGEVLVPEVVALRCVVPATIFQYYVYKWTHKKVKIDGRT